MPRYDFRCGAGHVHEAIEPVNVSARLCPQCGARAARVAVNHGHMPGVSGFVPTPTRYSRVNVSAGMEALSEIQHTAARHGVEMPDLWGAAKARVARGDVKAIE